MPIDNEIPISTYARSHESQPIRCIVSMHIDYSATGDLAESSRMAGLHQELGLHLSCEARLERQLMTRWNKAGSSLRYEPYRISHFGLHGYFSSNAKSVNFKTRQFSETVRTVFSSAPSGISAAISIMTDTLVPSPDCRCWITFSTI